MKTQVCEEELVELIRSNLGLSPGPPCPGTFQGPLGWRFKGREEAGSKSGEVVWPAGTGWWWVPAGL